MSCKSWLLQWHSERRKTFHYQINDLIIFFKKNIANWFLFFRSKEKQIQKHLSACANKSIKLEPYDVTTMYAYAQGGSHQVGPPHYASPPTYHMSPHMTSHHQLAASMPLATSLGAAAGMPTVEQHHLQNDHMSHHTPMHHMEPQLTELASQSKRRRYVILFYCKLWSWMCNDDGVVCYFLFCLRLQCY